MQSCDCLISVTSLWDLLGNGCVGRHRRLSLTWAFIIPTLGTLVCCRAAFFASSICLSKIAVHLRDCCSEVQVFCLRLNSGGFCACSPNRTCAHRTEARLSKVSSGWHCRMQEQQEQQQEEEETRGGGNEKEEEEEDNTSQKEEEDAEMEEEKVKVVVDGEEEAKVVVVEEEAEEE